MATENEITLAHGNGGVQMQELLSRIVIGRLGNETLNRQEDSAVLDVPPGARAVFTTDSFVVQPLFFPGGDIGHLAVCGTLNDLAMMGAAPAALSLALILEAGLPMATFERVIESIAATAEAAGVPIVTGDTKVVGPGQADKIFITTSGLGWRTSAAPTGFETVQEGDAIILSGTIGHHGVAILAARAELPFETELKTDATPLHTMVQELIQEYPAIRWMRDPTRGGVAAALNELASATGRYIAIENEAIPVTEEVRGAAELLGLDPLYLANEGRCVIVCAAADAEGVTAVLRRHVAGAGAVRFGTITGRKDGGRVVVTSGYGGTRIVDMPSGEQLPRIC